MVYYNFNEIYFCIFSFQTESAEEFLNKCLFKVLKAFIFSQSFYYIFTSSDLNTKSHQAIKNIPLKKKKVVTTLITYNFNDGRKKKFNAN